MIIQIINNNSKDWCDQYIIPKICQMKENASYIKKQNLLEIIEVFCSLFRKLYQMFQKRPSRMSIKIL